MRENNLLYQIKITILIQVVGFFFNFIKLFYVINIVLKPGEGCGRGRGRGVWEGQRERDCET